MTIQINYTTINNVRYFETNDAEISIFFNNDCLYSEEDIINLLKPLANYGIAVQYKDVCYGTNALIAIGKKEMVNTIIGVIE